MTEHLRQLQQQGYVVFQLLSALEASEVRALVYGLESEQHGFSTDVQHRIAELLPAGGALIARLVCHPALLELLRGFLGPTCRCATFSSNTLLPQDGSLNSGLGWHADYPYHDIDPPWPPAKFPLGCQVLICLDEFRGDNGGTMFMPDSHKDKPHGLEKDEDGTFPGSTVLTAPAGSVLVAHSAWWHRQTKNVSKLPRMALLGNYTAGHVVPKDNMEKQWHLLEEASQLQCLTKTERIDLERLLLGPYKRGLYRVPPQHGNVLT